MNRKRIIAAELRPGQIVIKQGTFLTEPWRQIYFIVSSSPCTTYVVLNCTSGSFQIHSNSPDAFYRDRFQEVYGGEGDEMFFFMPPT